MNPSENSLLKSIEQCQLSAITFVRGYLQLRFDGSVLTAYTLPKMASGDAVYEPTTRGYRDAVRSLIGRKVIATREEPDRALVIEFSNAILTVSLADEHKVCAESAMLQVDGGTRWNIW